MPTYKIVRFFQNLDIPSQIIATGLTLEEAQKYCQNPETSSKTCTTSTGKRRTETKGPWFDGYREEK
jgi:hypothetical protein